MAGVRTAFITRVRSQEVLPLLNSTGAGAGRARYLSSVHVEQYSEEIYPVAALNIAEAKKLKVEILIAAIGEF